MVVSYRSFSSIRAMDRRLIIGEMIMKLLEITKYSSGAYEPEREDFDLREFAQEWFDRNEGVALFEGGVTVDYGDAYRMCADKVYVFFKGSNEFDRVVATGGVAVTNETRTGSCETAVFRRREGEVEMHGGDGALARLSSSATDEVTGRTIKFWLDAEQVEVSGAEVKLGREKGKAVSL